MLKIKALQWMNEWEWVWTKQNENKMHNSAQNRVGSNFISIFNGVTTKRQNGVSFPKCIFPFSFVSFTSHQDEGCYLNTCSYCNWNDYSILNASLWISATLQTPRQGLDVEMNTKTQASLQCTLCCRKWTHMWTCVSGEQGTGLILSNKQQGS